MFPSTEIIKVTAKVETSAFLNPGLPICMCGWLDTAYSKTRQRLLIHGNDTSAIPRSELTLPSVAYSQSTITRALCRSISNDFSSLAFNANRYNRFQFLSSARSAVPGQQGHFMINVNFKRQRTQGLSAHIPLCSDPFFFFLPRTKEPQQNSSSRFPLV